MARTRRPAGTGSYDKVTDSKGRTFYRWRIGIYNPLDKKTNYKTIKAKSREVLDEKIEAWKAENASSGNLPHLPKRMTVQKWTEIWLDIIKNKLTEGTVYCYSKTVKKHVIPNFGQQWIGQVSPLDLQRYFDGLLDRISPTTVNTVRMHFLVCFEAAVRFKVISENPVKQTIPPKKEKPNLKILEESEVERLLAVARSGEYLPPPRNEAGIFVRKRNFLIVLLAVASGMREGEILGLSWSCVDLSSAKIEVKHTLQNLPSSQMLKSPKNNKTRTVVVPESVVRELTEWREYQAYFAEKYKGFYENQMNLVFTKAKGGPIGASHFYEWDFRALITKTDLVGTRFHDLRHFFASSALARGVSVMAVSEQLGHSSINITLARYTHVLERSRDEMKAMLNSNSLYNVGEVTSEGQGIEKNG